MLRADFHYELPEELIAQHPAARRRDSRLLHLDGASGSVQDLRFVDLPALLRAGDLLVFNDTRVVPARLHGRKDTGGRVEILLERVIDGGRVVAQLRASKPPATGSRILLPDGTRLTVAGRADDFWLLDFDEEPGAVFERCGEMPLPPYMKRAADDTDRERYQTVYAREPGAVAAPTAGLHFDAELLDACRQAGAASAHVTLHVGAGTFQPVRVDDLDQHAMHSEWLDVSATLAETVRRTRDRGGRIIAVGTTVVRALESAMRDGDVRAFSGETNIFIKPGVEVRSIDALLTNFHLPESTLLMLVSAFAGQERVFAAYAHAIAQHYRFFSYGDAMLLFPQAGQGA